MNKPLAPRPARPTRKISSTVLRPVKHLRFLHGDDGSLLGIEFEAPPHIEALQLVHQALGQRQVCIFDTSTRLTPGSMFQQLRLGEPGGEPLRGCRRSEVESMLLETLASVREP